MAGTLTLQVQEFLRPFGLFQVPDTPDAVITTKRGGRIYLDETPEGFMTRIIRSDGEEFRDTRPVDNPGKLAIAVRALVFKVRA